MRFLFITGNYKPAINSGGPVNSVSSLAEGLVRRGHEVTVLALNEDAGRPMEVPLRENVAVDGVSVFYFERRQSCCDKVLQRFTEVARWEPAFFKWCRAHLVSFDCAHIQVGLLSPSGWLARFCQLKGIALAYHQRGNLDPRRFGRLKWLKAWYIRFREAPVLHRADVLFALSEREADVYRMWTRSRNVQHLPNGVDAAFWAEGLTEKLLASPQREFPQVVWSARWDLRKGPLEFIAMAKIVSQLHPKVRFLMIGPEHGSDLRVVAAAAADLDQLILLKGLNREERREHLQKADIFVLPTYGEGFSLSILEALAAGCVVLTTQAANFPELEGTSFGRILENEPEIFADAVIKIVSEPADASGLTSKRASEFARDQFDWSKITDRYVAIVKAKVGS
jgi:glycosyltransferase involved in cell wall biosynthesis